MATFEYVAGSFIDGNLIVDQDKYNRLPADKQEIVKNIKGAVESSVVFTIQKTKTSEILPDGRTLDSYGGAATVANNGANGQQDMSGNSGVTIYWNGKGSTERLNGGKINDYLYETPVTTLYHEVGGHAYLRFDQKDPQQAGHTVDYENKVRKFGNDIVECI